MGVSGGAVPLKLVVKERERYKNWETSLVESIIDNVPAGERRDLRLRNESKSLESDRMFIF